MSLGCGAAAGATDILGTKSRSNRHGSCRKLTTPKTGGAGIFGPTKVGVTPTRLPPICSTIFGTTPIASSPMKFVAMTIF
jgi:hypothetical protein